MTRGAAAAAALVLSLGASARAQTSDAVAFREIPNRFQLAGAQNDPPPLTDYSRASAAELGAIIRSDQPLQRRVDAVRRLERLGYETQSSNPRYVATMQELLRTAEWLFADEGSLRFRRYGIFMLFSQSYSKIDGSLDYHPKDAREWALWKRVEALRRGGLKDEDPRLAEYFQRYVPLAQDPDWKHDAERLRTITQQLGAAYPQYDAALRDALAKIESVQTSQLAVRDRVLKSTGPGLSARERAQFVRAEEQEIAYRLHSAWANLYTAAVIEIVGPASARRANIVPVEVKLGWPAYTPPAR